MHNFLYYTLNTFISTELNALYIVYALFILWCRSFWYPPKCLHSYLILPYYYLEMIRYFWKSVNTNKDVFWLLRLLQLWEPLTVALLTALMKLDQFVTKKKSGFTLMLLTLVRNKKLVKPSCSQTYQFNISFCIDKCSKARVMS